MQSCENRTSLLNSQCCRTVFALSVLDAPTVAFCNLLMTKAKAEDRNEKIKDPFIVECVFIVSGKRRTTGDNDPFELSEPLKRILRLQNLRIHVQPPEDPLERFAQFKG